MRIHVCICMHDVYTDTHAHIYTHTPTHMYTYTYAYNVHAYICTRIKLQVKR